MKMPKAKASVRVSSQGAISYVLIRKLPHDIIIVDMSIPIKAYVVIAPKFPKNSCLSTLYPLWKIIGGRRTKRTNSELSIVTFWIWAVSPKSSRRRPKIIPRTVANPDSCKYSIFFCLKAFPPIIARKRISRRTRMPPLIESVSIFDYIHSKNLAEYIEKSVGILRIYYKTNAGK